MLILCMPKYFRLASCVHNSNYCIHLSTQEYKMHSGVASSEPSEPSESKKEHL